MITVNTIVDELNSDADCSLREAVQAANTDAAVSGCPAGDGADTIAIPAGVYTLSLAGAGPLELTDAVTLTGASAAATLLDGNADGRSVIQTRFTSLLTCGFDNSIRKFTSIGKPAGVLVAAGAGGLSVANAAVIDNSDDGILLVSGFSSGVKRYVLPSGAFSDTLAATSGAYGSRNTLSASDILMVPGEFQFLVADFFDQNNLSGSGRILKFDSRTGAFLGEFVTPGSGGLKTPNSMVFSGSHLYVTDATNNTVLRYNKTTGAFVDVFVSAGSGGLDRPRDLLFYGANLLVISEVNNRVLRYNATTGASNGALITSGLDKPQGMAIGPDGALHVNSQNTKTLKRFDPATGAALGVAIDATDGANGVGCPTFVDGIGVGPRVQIENLTIRNSVTNGSPGTGHGVFNGVGVNMTIERVVVRDNVSNSPGAGVANGGVLSVIESTIMANRTFTGTGGGTQYSGGGIMNFSAASLRVIRSTVSDNISVRGGGIRNAGGTMTIENSTISGNRAQSRGGGIMNFGTATIRFSTITDNEAYILAWGSDMDSEPYGGGLFNQGQVTLSNSVLAGNRDNRTRFDANYAPDCWSALPDANNLTSRRGNLIGVLNVRCPLKDISTGDTANDLTGTDTTPLNARLGPLANNGGPTHTHLPQSISPLIDAAVTTSVGCPALDQRVADRPVDGNADGTNRCDIGAVEFGAEPPTRKLFAPVVVRS
jgi:CSLREA domain-containing protein